METTFKVRLQWLEARAADIDPPEQRFIKDSRQRERVRKRNLGVALA
jgi:hypothetical protein